MRPLMPASKWEMLRETGLQFATSPEATKLQRFLYFKKLWANNYVSDWCVCVCVSPSLSLSLCLLEPMEVVSLKDLM